MSYKLLCLHGKTQQFFIFVVFNVNFCRKKCFFKFFKNILKVLCKRLQNRYIIEYNKCMNWGRIGQKRGKYENKQ